MKNVKTLNVSDVVAVTQEIGDKLTNHYNKNNDLKVVQTALSAYKTSIAAAKAQLIYKKLTGSPMSIKFFESEG